MALLEAAESQRNLRVADEQRRAPLEIDMQDTPLRMSEIKTLMRAFVRLNLKPEEVKIRRSFTGTESEKWFYAVHVAIEANGSRALPAIDAALSPGAGPDALLAGVQVVRESMQKVTFAFLIFSSVEPTMPLSDIRISVASRFIAE